MSPELRLVRRAAQGDDDAYSRWLAELRPQLVRYASDRLGGDRAEAEDVVQDSAMRALVALRGGKVPANPRAWMYVIVRNRCHDARAARRPSIELEAVAEAASPSPGPDERAGDRRRLAAVVAAISELPDSQRDALVGTVFEGRPYEEVAARQHTSVSAVKSLVHRARRGVEASGARAAAIAPWILALRVRLRGLGLGGGGDTMRDGLAGAFAQHTTAVAGIAAVAVAVPVAAHDASHAHHQRPPARHAQASTTHDSRSSGHATHHAQPSAPAKPAPHAAGSPTLRAATVTSGDPAAALAACRAGQPLTGHFSMKALARAKRQMSAQDSEYGTCGQRLGTALLNSTA